MSKRYIQHCSETVLLTADVIVCRIIVSGSMLAIRSKRGQTSFVSHHEIQLDNAIVQPSIVL